MLGKSKWLSIAVVVAVATIGLSSSVAADSGTEQGFLSKINAERSSRGLVTLTVDSNLRAHARNHTADMIAAGEIFHSTASELRAAAGTGWTKLGENVGRGGTVDSLHDAFMNSPSHKQNILGDYNYVGIGTGTNEDGVLYVTVVFMKKGSTDPTTTTTTSPASTTTTKATTPTTKASTPTTSAPTTTLATTTTTLPPTTTTTLIVGPDKPVTPGESCVTATRFWWLCHD